jgi:hypothetical protein
MDVLCWLNVNSMKILRSSHLDAIFILIKCHVMSFLTKISCDLWKVTRRIRSHIKHLQLKNSHLWLTKPILNMQISCIVCKLNLGWALIWTFVIEIHGCVIYMRVCVCIHFCVNSKFLHCFKSKSFLMRTLKYLIWTINY